MRRQDVAEDGPGSDPVSRQIIGLAMRVQSGLGPGYLEKVYENALVHELQKAGFDAEQQVPLHVWYDGVVVGEYIADLIVDTPERRLLLELKAISSMPPVLSAQVINYLTATQIPVGLLINFGAPRLQFKRLTAANLQLH